MSGSEMIAHWRLQLLEILSFECRCFFCSFLLLWNEIKVINREKHKIDVIRNGGQDCD